jgi:twitching motility protein PilT
MDIAELLAFSVKNNASDLHLSAGLPPMIRVDGDMRRINVPVLEHKTVHALFYDIMNDKQRKDYEEFFETTSRSRSRALARFRVNAYNQKRGAAAVFRTIPSKVLTLEDLNCPRVFKDICRQWRAAGPGDRADRLGQVDDAGRDDGLSQRHRVRPHPDDRGPDRVRPQSKKCLINQREVHKDTLGFSEALRSALREDPDIILVGEMRDLETIRLAMTAAETGHLVFGTLHTSSAAKTIDRIVDVFPAAKDHGPLDAVGIAARGDFADVAEEDRRRARRVRTRS